jgi:hypothetical protein
MIFPGGLALKDHDDDQRPNREQNSAASMNTHKDLTRDNAHRPSPDHEIEHAATGKRVRTKMYASIETKGETAALPAA